MAAVYDRLVALVIALCLLAALVPAAKADGFEDALGGFALDSYADTEAAITAVAASGNPLAEELIVALQDGRLLFSDESKKIYFDDKSGNLRDATTGKPAAGTPPADLAP